MTVENIQANGNPAYETDQTNDNPQDNGNEVVALSVNDKSKQGSQGLNLVHQPSHLPGNRPVEASHLQIVDTYSSVGGARPVIASGINIKGTLTVSGNRPIAASHLQVSETYTVMGNRPVASNEVDDSTTLMGYLD